MNQRFNGNGIILGTKLERILQKSILTHFQIKKKNNLEFVLYDLISELVHLATFEDGAKDKKPSQK